MPDRRLRQLIQRSLRALERPGEGPPDYIPQRRQITPEESAGFFRAIDEGFFEVEPTGYCRPRTIRPSTGYRYPLLERPLKAENRVRLWREWLTHAAIVARLHLDPEYGYERRNIALEVDAFDVLVWSPRNQPLIAVETKKTVAELDALIQAMLALQGRPFEFPAGRRLNNAEQKFRALLALRPRFFLGVAPGRERAFRVTYTDDGQDAALRPTKRVPRARPIEISKAVAPEEST